MTPELGRRWKGELTPFDGTAVATCDDPTLTDVLEMLRFLVERLQQQKESIWIYEDWHEHDGFVTNPTQISWSEFEARLSSPKGLYESRNSDEYVRVGLFPESFSWLLRYNIEDCEDIFLNAWCSVDFSCTPSFPAARIASEIHFRWPGFTDLSPAKEFFDNSYGG